MIEGLSKEELRDLGNNPNIPVGAKVIRGTKTDDGKVISYYFIVEKPNGKRYRWAMTSSENKPCHYIPPNGSHLDNGFYEEDLFENKGNADWYYRQASEKFLPAINEYEIMEYNDFERKVEELYSSFFWRLARFKHTFYLGSIANISVGTLVYYSLPNISGIDKWEDPLNVLGVGVVSLTLVFMMQYGLEKVLSKNKVILRNKTIAELEKLISS